MKDYLNDTRVSSETTRITLGKSFEKVSTAALLKTSKRLLGVMRGDEDPDERESLIFKDLYSTDDLLIQYFEKQKEPLHRKLKWRMKKKDNLRDIISSRTFTDPIRSFFTTGDLSATPTQTNPVQILHDAQKTTVMGQGGIGSRHAVTEDVRNVHPTHFGFLDPVSTPEGATVGTNVGLTRDIVKDDKTIKAPVRVPSGKKEYWDVEK